MTRRGKLSILAFVGSLMLAGCGGSGGGGSTDGCGSFAIYSGNFTGTWNASNGDTGSATIKINGETVTGTDTDTTANATYTLGGSVASPNCPSTAITLTETTSGATTTYKGTVSAPSGNVNEFSGTLTETGSSTVTQTFTNMAYSGG
jgi:hypothetical protein